MNSHMEKVDILLIKLKNHSASAKERLSHKLAGNSFTSGAGALEVIVITVILLGLALIFRKEVWAIFENVQGELTNLGDSVDNIKFSDKL